MSQLSLFDHWKICWNEKPWDYKGRASVREFWGFVLYSFLNYIVACLKISLLGLALFIVIGEVVVVVFEWVFILMGVFVFVRGLMVGARRLHDTGRSAWWLLLGLIPMVGLIALILFLCGESQPTKNRWGDKPL